MKPLWETAGHSNNGDRIEFVVALLFTLVDHSHPLPNGGIRIWVGYRFSSRNAIDERTSPSQSVKRRSRIGEGQDNFSGHAFNRNPGLARPIIRYNPYNRHQNGDNVARLAFVCWQNAME
jgi:hypothetical protein